jgi:cytochrome c-type biogenesis protein CcmE
VSNRGAGTIKRKHQRLILVVLAMAALIGAGMLAAWALRNQAAYFYVPSELLAKPPATDRDVRLGGMVERGSITPQADRISIQFVLADGKARVPVRFTGIVPDLFQEGSGAVTEGRLGADGTFMAERLLAKHDENYMPREMKDMTPVEAQQVVAETQ